jgi:thiol:disulfide interchange protein DsbD
VFTLNLIATSVTDAELLAVDVRFQLCNDTFCLPPRTKRVSFAGEEDVKKSAFSSQPTADGGAANNQLRTSNQPPTDLWSFIWLAVTFGAISLLTPCVFPMIPITVSYFMKHSDGDH